MKAVTERNDGYSHIIRHITHRLRDEAETGHRSEYPDQQPQQQQQQHHQQQLSSNETFCTPLKPPGGPHCPQTWDSILCWPPTKPESYAFVRCMSEFKGIKYDTSYNASKFCFANATWDNHSNYENCTPLFLEPEYENETTHLTSTLYYIGYSISLVALLIAMWIFIYFKDLRCLRNTIHTNLMSTFVMTNFMWIVTNIWQDMPQADLPSCAILILILHYFHTTTFFWMFVEGLYLYILVVETFNRKNIKTHVYMAIGWGVPLIIIIIWGATRALAPDRMQDGPSDLPSNNCHWMNATVYDWIFKVPILTVMALNSIFLVMIMWVLITKLRSANNAETQQYMKAAKALLVLIPLLGITYILFIVSFNDGSIFAKVFYCIRAFMLSSQGLLVAFFFCFLNSEVQNTVRHRMESWRTARSLGGRRYTISRDWSPRSRTESIRLYSQPTITPYRKRESCSSEVTTTTSIGIPNTLNPSIRISNGSANSQKLSAPFLEVSSENEV